MTYFYKVLKVLAVVAVGGVAAACGEAPRQALDPEADHCSRAAARLTRDIGTISIIEAKAWTHGEIRNARVRFAYPPHNEAGLINGNMLCTYAFPMAERGDAKRHPQAASIYFRARHLSTNELLLLNMGLRGTKP